MPSLSQKEIDDFDAMLGAPAREAPVLRATPLRISAPRSNEVTVPAAAVDDYEPVGFSVPNLKATTFVSGEPAAGNFSAYGGLLLPRLKGQLAVSLPYKFESPDDHVVELTAGGRTVRAKLADVGPWNVDDEYWAEEGRRPAVEGGKTVKRPMGGFRLGGARGEASQSAIDMSPDLARALFPDRTKGKSDEWIAEKFSGPVESMRVLRRRKKAAGGFWPAQLEPAGEAGSFAAAPVTTSTTAATVPAGSPAAASKRTLSSEDIAELDAMLQGPPGAPGVAPVPRDAPLERDVRLSPEMDDAAIASSLGYDVERLKRSSMWRPGVLKERFQVLPPEPPPQTLPGQAAKMAGDVTSSFYRGLVEDPIDALSQYTMRGAEKLGLQKPEDVELFEAMQKVDEANYQENTRGGKLREDAKTEPWYVPNDPGRLAGNIAVPLPVAGVAAQGAGVARRLAVPAIAGATGATLASRIEDTAPEVGGVTDDFGRRVITRAGIAAAAGPVLQLGMSGAGKLIAKGVNARLGNVAPEFAESARMAPGDLPGQPTTLRGLSEEMGMPLSFGDETRIPGAQRVEQLTEKVPFGFSDFRKDQQGIAAAKAIVLGEQARDRMVGLDFDGVDLIERTAATPRAIYQDTATKALELINTAGDDPEKILQASLNAQLALQKIIGEGFYDKVGKLSKAAGDFSLRKTLKATKAWIKDLKSVPLYNEAALAKLERLEEELQGTLTDYSTARKIVSNLDDIVADYYSNADAAVGRKGAHVFTDLTNVLEREIDDFAINSGNAELMDAGKVARKHWREKVIPFRDPDVAVATKKPDYQLIYGRFIKPKRDFVSKTLHGVLDEKGRASVRAKMIENALNVAIHENKGIFSPAKFAGYLERFRDASDVFFKGREAWQLNGMAKLMRAAERAGQYMENPPTGQQLIVGGMALGVAAGRITMGEALATLAATGALTKLFTTEAGKRFLTAASDLRVGSPRMDAMLQKLIAEAPRLTGQALSRKAQEKR